MDTMERLRRKRIEALAVIPFIKPADLAKRRPCSEIFALGYLDGATQITHGRSPDPALMHTTDEYAKGYQAAYNELAHSERHAR